MTVYVLGAGASHDAGYPLAADMATELLRWMKRPMRVPHSYAARYPAIAQFIEESFSPIGNIEDLITDIQRRIRELETGTTEQRVKRAQIADAYGVFQNALRDWFAEIQRGKALESVVYRDFARNVVSPGDCIITFNYDVSLEHELRRAGKFEIGNGYWFPIEGLPAGSRTTLLKLHGSTSWLALLFGGFTHGTAYFQPGQTLGVRPVIGSNELEFLGYKDSVDPRFRNGGAALPVMIFPARSKEFYFSPNTGVEYVKFWDDLWDQAEKALAHTSKVVICGYSLLSVNERARNMLLSAPRKDAEILVASGDERTGQIVQDYLCAGYTKAVAAPKTLFQDWVASISSSLATI